METAMSMERSLLEKWRLLPGEKQQEVLDFVESIEQNLRLNKDANTAASTESPTRLSMQEIARLTVAERQKILAPYMAATAEDFLNDSELEVNTNELRIKCQHPESIKRFFKDMLEKELNLLSNSIKRTENRLHEFETKYQLSREEFWQRYRNDEFEETLELDEWIGESLMLKRLREKLDIYGAVHFVD